MELKQWKKGTVSFVISLLVWLLYLLVFLFYPILAFEPLLIASCFFICFISSIVGFATGIAGLLEKDRKHALAWFGTVLSFLFLLMVLIIAIIGLPQTN